jgi:hypothetical protein
MEQVVYSSVSLEGFLSIPGQKQWNALLPLGRRYKTDREIVSVISLTALMIEVRADFEGAGKVIGGP